MKAQKLPLWRVFSVHSPLIRMTLRYLGVPIKSKAYMFGVNKSVVMSSTDPHSLLSKRQNILSYHRVREAIAAKIMVFHWCDSSQNKSDILSKHLECSKVFHIIRDLFDFQGKITLIKLEYLGLISQDGE